MIKNKILIPLGIVFLFGLVSLFLNHNPIGLDTWYHISLSNQIIDQENVSYQHPFDNQFLNNYPYNYHLIFSTLSLITGLSVLFLINLSFVLFWILNILTIYMMADYIFDEKTAFYSALLASLLPTSQFIGGFLFPFPRITGLFLILISLFFLLKYLENKGLNYFLLFVLFIISLNHTHLFTGAILMGLSSLMILINFKIKYIKYLFLTFFLTLGSQLIFILPLIFRFGFENRAKEVLSASKSVTITMIPELIGIPIFIIAFLSIFLIFQKLLEEKNRKVLFLFLWFISFFILSQFWRLNIITVSHRFFFIAIIPLLILSGYCLKNLFSHINDKKAVAIIMVLFFLIQSITILDWIQSYDINVLSSEEFEALDYLGKWSDAGSRVFTDEWSCYYVSAISKRQCLYVTGIFNPNSKEKYEDLWRILLYKQKNLINKYSGNENYILIFKKHTPNWVYSRSGLKWKDLINLLNSPTSDVDLFFENDLILIFKVK